MASTQKCFVIMPYGKKSPGQGQRIIDFDLVYKRLIESTLASMTDPQIEHVRCDEINMAGLIQRQMFQQIYEADIAIVDITSLNPNVFYELGVRHALADRVTVLLRGKGTKIPFNIQDLKVIDYDPNPKKLSDPQVSNKIKEFIRNGLKTNDDTSKDSPVHDVLKLRITTAAEALKKAVYEYPLKNVEEKKIGIVTGDIRKVTGIDVWVNSENTNMEMARPYDGSISGIIRYCGARKNKVKKIIHDTIAKELTALMGDAVNIAPGEVIVTGSGELKKDNGVKRVFHAAAVVGEPGKGYAPISDVGVCVAKALKAADEQKRYGLQSILFPLIGTGTAKGEVERRTRQLIEAAIEYFENNPSSSVERVYFLAYSEKELKVCERILHGSPGIVFKPRAVAANA